MFDVYKNAKEYYSFWKDDLTEIKKHALCQVLSGCVKFFIEKDKLNYKECINLIYTIYPRKGYIPQVPLISKIIASAFGYEFMEEVAFRYRKIKFLIMNNQ
jgi:hypothetical protein